MLIATSCNKCGFTSEHHVNIPKTVKEERERIIELLSNERWFFPGMSPKNIKHLLTGLFNEDNGEVD